MSSPFRAFCFLLLTFANPGFAAMEFPPELRTREEYAKFAAEIRRKVPETLTGAYRIEAAAAPGQGIESYLAIEQQLLQRLKLDPRYMAMANARPALQTLRFQKLDVRKASATELRPEWTELRSRYRSAEALSLAQLIEKLEQISSTQVFSSLSHFTSVTARAYLREPDLTTRWTLIRPELESRPIERLRQELQISKIGVHNSAWTLADLDQVIEAVTTRENRIAVEFQKLYELNTRDFTHAWFEQESSSRIANLILGDELGAKFAPAVSSLGRRFAKLYGARSPREQEPVVNSELVLRELPPYLAIYRGCVGLDCSTSHSWAFPYSPLERNWWIETPAGDRLGYISGNITTVNGEPCLYIRDVHGPKVKASDIELIFNGFYLSRELYGVTQMTIAPQTFLPESHFPELIAASDRFVTAGNVEQIFADDWLRTGYLGVAPSSGLQFDGVANHRYARKVEPSAQALSGFRVLKNSQTVAEAEPPDVWTSIEIAVLAADPQAMAAHPEPTPGIWTELINTIRNQRNLRLIDYYAAVENVMQRAGLKLSRNLRKKYEDMFLFGHLQAPDAFLEPSELKQSVRYVQEILWRSPKPGDAKVYLRENISAFESSETFSRAAEGLLERRQATDEERLKVLWSSGYRFRQVSMTGAHWGWILGVLRDPKITLALYAQALDEAPRSALFQALSQNCEPLAKLLENKKGQPESIAVEAAALLWRFSHPFTSTLVTKELAESIEEEENLDILIPVASLYLREISSVSEVGARAYRILKRNLDQPNVGKVWNQIAHEVLLGLSPETTEKYQTEYTIYLQTKLQQARDPNCEVALEAPRRRGRR